MMPSGSGNGMPVNYSISNGGIGPKLDGSRDSIMRQAIHFFLCARGISLSEFIDVPGGTKPPLRVPLGCAGAVIFSQLDFPSMMMRNLPIVVGSTVRAREAHPYNLPLGLPDNAEVKVVSYDPKTYGHIVRDGNGREWSISARQNLDAGSEYMVGGRWLPEVHPLVLHELRKLQKKET